MRWILALWLLPLALFWGWYFLSLNDIHMGYVLLTRQAHDLIFQFYSEAIALVSEEYLGERVTIEPTEIPGMLARAFVLDTLLLVALLAFRRRRALIAWARAMRARHGDAAPSLPSA